MTKDKKKIALLEASEVGKHAFVSFEELRQQTQRAYDGCYANRRPTFVVLGQALEKVNRFAPAIDVMVQQQPFVVNLVWGSVRFIIQTLAAESAAAPEIEEGLNQIIRDVPRYEDELRVYAEFPRVFHATTAVFAQIVRYLVHAKFFLIKSHWRRSFNAAAAPKLTLILHDLHNRNDALDREIRAARGAGEMELNQVVSQMVSQSSILSVSAWLEAGHMKTKVADTREPGTCEWFSNCATYTGWVDAGYENCLCVQGDLGCGKTVLAAHLADKLAAEIPVLAYSFHGVPRGCPEATARFAVTLLKTLFQNGDVNRQSRFPPILRRATCLARQYSSGLECPPVMLLDILDSLLALIPSFALVVDALDECSETKSTDSDDYNRLINYVRRLGLRKGTRVIVLARTGSFLKDLFAGSRQLCIDESYIKPDIVRFVEREIDRNQGRNPGLVALKADIIAKVSKDCHAETTYDVSETLDKFPVALTEIYQKQLTTINTRLSDDDRKRQHSIFLVLLGAFEPMTAHDISTLLALDADSNTVEDGKKLSNPTAAVLRLCEPLVNVVRDQVQFVHVSVKDFLLRSLFRREDSDEFLARICLSTLSQNQYQVWTYAARLLRQNLLSGIMGWTTHEKSFKESVFYKYACLHWQDHVTALEDPSDELLVKLATFLLGNEFVTWSEVLFQLKPNSSIGPQIQVRARFLAWYEKLADGKKEKIPIQDFFVTVHESIFGEFMEKGDDVVLIYSPYIRLGLYFNVGGQSGFDFQKAYEYKSAVAEYYEASLGRRNPLTLRARTELFKEFFFKKRFDDAESGLKEVADLQREVIGNDVFAYFLTLQLLGAAQHSLANFEVAAATFTETANGFRKLSGETELRALMSEMCVGWALERTPRIEDAYRRYNNLLELWVPIGGPKHPFSLMLKTSLGSACRKLAHFQESEVALRESLSARKSLFSIEAEITVDSVLQLAALFYDTGRGKECIEYLDQVSGVCILKNDFERRCQAQHIRALVQFEAGLYTQPKADLQQLLNEASGQECDRNNRELLWIRTSLATVLRQHGEEDEALMLFSDLVTPCEKDFPLVPSHEDLGHKFPCTLQDEPESPAQLAIAELALKLLKQAKPDEADELLRENSLQWRRKKDFWVLQGGPITDTAIMRSLRLPDYQIVELPVEPSNETVRCKGIRPSTLWVS